MYCVDSIKINIEIKKVDKLPLNGQRSLITFRPWDLRQREISNHISLWRRAHTWNVRHRLPFIGNLLTFHISISRYLRASFLCTLEVRFLLSTFVIVSVLVWSLFSLVLITVSIYFNRLQNTGAKLFRISNFFICCFIGIRESPSRTIRLSISFDTIIPVLTFAKCRVSRIPFLACTNVASRCISASCIFMTVATNTTLVQIYTGSVDKELKLNFFFALIHPSIFLINCERAESYGFLEYYWLCERALFATSNYYMISYCYSALSQSRSD